jgi:peroxiredoxin
VLLYERSFEISIANFAFPSNMDTDDPGTVVRVGYNAPHFVLPYMTDSTLTLDSRSLQNKNVVLVFLRHLGWSPWKEHVRALHDAQEQLPQPNTIVVLISFVREEEPGKWQSEIGTTFTMLLDEDRWGMWLRL